MNAVTATATPTTDEDRLAELKGFARDGLNEVREYGREHAPGLTQKVEDGASWLQSLLPDIDKNDLLAGSAGAALGWATGGSMSSIVMLGSLALAAKSAFIDGDYKMASTYALGGFAASSLIDRNIGAAALSGAAAFAVNKFWPQISDTAEQVADRVVPQIKDTLGFG